jgi:hypothetical protein
MIQSQQDPRDVIKGYIKTNLDNASKNSQIAINDMGSHPIKDWLEER